MAKRKRSAFSCKSRSQRRPSPRLSASLGPPFTALSRQGGYAHILKGYFYTNLVGTLVRDGNRPPERFRPSIALADMRSEHPITLKQITPTITHIHTTTPMDI